MTRVRNCQHTAVTEVRTNSWWEMVLQNLFFASGESVFQPSRRDDTEVQIDTDCLLIPVCDGPMTALTEP